MVRGYEKTHKPLGAQTLRRGPAKFHWRYEAIERWFELRTALCEIVSRLRLWQRGLRPLGPHELEYERDKQLVLREHHDEQLDGHSLEAIQKRLASFTILQPSKLRDDRFHP